MHVISLYDIIMLTVALDSSFGHNRNVNLWSICLHHAHHLHESQITPAWSLLLASRGFTSKVLQNLGEVFWKFSTTTPNKTHKGSTCSFNGTWFCWPWLKRKCFNKLGKQSISQNMRSCLSISSGLPNNQLRHCSLAVLHV